MVGVESRLEEFGNAMSELSAAGRQPKTAFDLLGATRYEDAWQSYLRYFLDPEQPHQLEGEFLVQFFDLLNEQELTSFSPPELGLRRGQGVDVTTEYQSEDDNRIDLIVSSGSEWFLCIELKVHASEGRGEDPQTVRYANDDGIVPDGVSAYADGDYLYIKPEEAAPSAAGEFSDLAWNDVKSIVQDTLARSTGRVPVRSIAQLSDFSTLIDSQVAMTDVDTDTRKRKDLYFEYREEIDEAQDAIDEFVETVLQQQWGQELEGDFQPANASEMEWQYDAIGRGYGQIRTPRWTTAKTGSEKLDIHWEHKPKTDDFKKGQLRFILELEEPGRSTISKSSGERYHQLRNQVLEQVENSVLSVDDPRWKEWDENPSTSKKKLVRFVYEYEPGDEDGYYQCLQYALEDCEPVARLVTELLDGDDFTEYSLE